jgi:hypothetical protein
MALLLQGSGLVMLQHKPSSATGDELPCQLLYHFGVSAQWTCCGRGRCPSEFGWCARGRSA